MRKTSHTLTLATALLLLPVVSNVSAEDQTMDEVVVTGSYLKRNAADSPSPLSVVTSADIEDLGAADVSEIIQSMPWSSGSQTRAATFGGETSNGQNSINLRNLGQAATLPLVNGKRNVASWYNPLGNASVNVNALIPNIAIERIEVVKDGTSALYGSDAIAGVVNFITKKTFEGFDVNYQYTVDKETSDGDAHTIGMIWGLQGDRGGIMVAASVLNRSTISTSDNYDRFGGTTVSTTGQPGRLKPIAGQTIIWDAHGLEPGQETALPRNAQGTSFGQADVNCEDSAKLGRNGALGTFAGDNICVYDFGTFFALQAEESLRKIFVDGHYNITDDVNIYYEFASNDSEFDRANSLNPNAPALAIPVSVKGQDNPGSIEDAFRRGIIPIEYANVTRLQGGTLDTAFQYRPIKTFTKASRADSRYVVGGVWDFQIGDRDWTLDASYTASQHITAYTNVQDTQSAQMELAINGLGGPACDTLNGVPGEGNASYAASGGDFDAGGCYFFNVFGNSRFDRDGNLGQPDLTLVNPPELYNWLSARENINNDFRQRVIDIVAAGDLFETRSGTWGLAVGFQRRQDTAEQLFNSALNSNNLDFTYGKQDWKGRLTTTAYFFELGIPLGDTLQINLAARYEDFDEIDEDSTDPKISLLWQPTATLSLRASAGSSFRVPSLLQLSGHLTTVANQNDIVGGVAFKPSITAGNPELVPESSDNYNLGFSWAPGGILEGFQIDMDYFNYDYSDIITRESSSNLLAQDNAALVAYVAANPGSTFIDAVNAGAGNREQVIRNSEALLLRLLPNFANANGAEVSGYDVNSSYSFDTGWGSWRVGVQAAYMDEYTVSVPNPDGSETKLDAVGNYNKTNPVARPLPELKLNGTLNWSMNRHRLFLIVKYVDGIDSDVSAGTRGFYAATTRLAGNGHLSADFLDTKIESFTTADVQYSFDFGEAGFLADSSVTIGIQNFTDEEPPIIATTTAADPTLHDPRGMIYFVRIGGSM